MRRRLLQIAGSNVGRSWGAIQKEGIGKKVGFCETHMTTRSTITPMLELLAAVSYLANNWIHKDAFRVSHSLLTGALVAGAICLVSPSHSRSEGLPPL